MKVKIANSEKVKLPQISFEAIKKAALGANYDLALVIASPKEIKRLNLTYRNLDKPTDILSFPLSKTEGEMYICPPEARKEARKFGRTYENFFAFLFIHGCTHLKGHEHGATMEKYEVKLRKKFGI